ELHFGVPSVRLNVATEGGHFVHDTVAVEHANRAEFDADRDRGAGAEYLAHSGGMGRGCQIPIEMALAKERVSDGPANAPGLEPGGFEPPGNVEDVWRRIEVRHRVRFRDGC